MTLIFDVYLCLSKTFIDLTALEYSVGSYRKRTEVAADLSSYYSHNLQSREESSRNDEDEWAKIPLEEEADPDLDISE